MDLHDWFAVLFLGGIWGALVVLILLNRPKKEES